MDNIATWRYYFPYAWSLLRIQLTHKFRKRRHCRACTMLGNGTATSLECRDDDWIMRFAEAYASPSSSRYHERVFSPNIVRSMFGKSFSVAIELWTSYKMVEKLINWFKMHHGWLSNLIPFRRIFLDRWNATESYFETFEEKKKISLGRAAYLTRLSLSYQCGNNRYL